MINILFKIINFLVLLFLAAYYFRKNIIPSLRKKIIQARDNYINIVNQKQNTRKEYDSLLDRKQHNEKVYNDLIAKLDTWHGAVEYEQQRYNAKKIISQQKIQLRTAQQADYLQHALLYSTILPQALHESSQELKHYFERDNNGQKYNEHIIALLNKGS